MNLEAASQLSKSNDTLTQHIQHQTMEKSLRHLALLALVEIIFSEIAEYPEIHQERALRVLFWNGHSREVLCGAIE